MARYDSGVVVAAGVFQGDPGEASAVLVRIGRDPRVVTTLLRADDVSGEILAVAVHPDGRIVIGGDFRSIRGVPRRGLACLRADGGVDQAFDPHTGADGAVRTVLVQPDGRIVVGGSFRLFDRQDVARIVRVLPNGGIDPEWVSSARPDQTVYTLGLGPTGSIYMGGDFTMVGGEVRSYVAKLLPNGAVDRSFAPGPGPNAPVRSVSVTAGGQVFIGGFFTDVSGLAWNRIGRLNPSGQPDAGFQPGSGATGPVLATALEEDGSVWIGGAFLRVDGQDTPNIARLDPSGRAIRSVRNYGTDGPVVALASVGPGQVILGGEFSTVQGKIRIGIAGLGLNQPPLVGLLSFNPAGTRLPVGHTVVFRVQASDPDGRIQDGIVEYSKDGLNYSTLGSLSFNDTGFGSLEVSGLQQGTYHFRARLQDDDAETTTGKAVGPVEVVSLRDYFGVFNVNVKATELRVDEGIGTLRIPVVRSVGTNGTVTVRYLTQDSEATGNGVDYVSGAGEVVFEPGVTERDIVVDVVEDGNYEQDERLIIRLLGADNGAEVPGQAGTTVTILDNDLPLAFPKSLTTSEDSPLSFRLSGTLTRTNLLSFRIVQGPSRGVVVPPQAGALEGDFVYRPATNFAGLDSFDFVVNDGRKDSLAARVSVDVRAVNDPPVIEVPREVAMVEDQVGVVISLLVSDLEAPAGELTLVGSSSNPALFTDAGLVFGGAGAVRTLRLSPLPGKNGEAFIRISLSDGTDVSTATITVRVSAVNDPPKIDGMVDVVMREDETYLGPPLGVRDDESSASLLRLTITSDDESLIPPDGARIVESATGARVSIRPAADRSGITMVTVQVSDGLLSSSIRFRVTVTPLNDPPRAVDDTVSALEGGGPIKISVGTLVSNDIDPDGDPLLFGGVDEETEQGSRVVWNGLLLTMTPRAGFSGVDRFRYRIQDPGGLMSTGRVEVLVRRKNQPPIAVGDTIVTPEDTALEGAFSLLLDNDYDPEGGPIHLVAVSPRSALGGQVWLSGGRLHYSPPRGGGGWGLLHVYDLGCRGGEGLRDGHGGFRQQHA